VLGRIALAKARSVFLPLGSRHVVALGKAHRIIQLASGQVAEVNGQQLSAAIDYVYLRPGSPLMSTVRSFAQERENALGTAAA
jgi:hypothetical protein